MMKEGNPEEEVAPRRNPSNYIGPGHIILHTHALLTLGKILDLYVETPATGLPEPISWSSGPNLCFPCIYILNKPKERKKVHW
jgi:hypothetical protein